MNKKNIISSILVALLLTAVWFYIYKDLNNEQTNDTEVNNNATSSDSSLIKNLSFVTEDGEEALITVMEDESQISQAEQLRNTPIPDLNRKIVFSDDFSEEAQKIMTEKIEKVIQELKNDPKSFDNWLTLGLHRKTISDYEGAKLAWEYAKVLDQNNSVVRGNLGDIYAYYLNDNQKAEENYLKALELGSSQVHLYFKVVEFYRDILKNNERAKEIVQFGLSLNPDSPELQSLLNSL